MAAAGIRSIGSASDGPPIGPADAYRIAVEEYRFQAQFNWGRSQYLLALNAAILAAAAGLYAAAGDLAVLVFGLGALASLCSVLVVHTQHRYYQTARDHLRRVEVTLAIPEDLRLDTTAKLGGRRRLVSVNQVLYFVLICITAADLAGAIMLLVR